MREGGKECIEGSVRERSGKTPTERKRDKRERQPSNQNETVIYSVIGF